MLARTHAFDIFEWDALCGEQRRSFFPIHVFSSEVNIYSAEMHSHMNVDLCKLFSELVLNVVYVMPGLVSLIANLSLECCGMRLHELFIVSLENNASYCFAC